MYQLCLDVINIKPHSEINEHKFIMIEIIPNNIAVFIKLMTNMMSFSKTTELNMISPFKDTNYI